MTDDQELLPPDEAFEVAVATLEEWQQHAANALADGVISYPETMLSTAVSRMASGYIRDLAAHQPVYIGGAWVCPSCVEMQQVGFTRAAAPCAEARAVFETVLGANRLQEPTPGGLQAIVQDGAEPWVSLGAAELERMHGLPPAQARTLSSSVVRIISGARRRARR